LSALNMLPYRDIERLSAVELRLLSLLE